MVDANASNAITIAALLVLGMPALPIMNSLICNLFIALRLSICSGLLNLFWLFLLSGRSDERLPLLTEELTSRDYTTEQKILPSTSLQRTTLIQGINPKEAFCASASFKIAARSNVRVPLSVATARVLSSGEKRTKRMASSNLKFAI